MKNIAIIGAGNMGGAIYKSLTKIISKENLFVCEQNLDRIKELGVLNYSEDVNEIVEKAEIIIFAVKPQSLENLVEQIKIDLDQT